MNTFCLFLKGKLQFSLQMEDFFKQVNHNFPWKPRAIITYSWYNSICAQQIPAFHSVPMPQVVLHSTLPSPRFWVQYVVNKFISFISPVLSIPGAFLPCWVEEKVIKLEFFILTFMVSSLLSYTLPLCCHHKRKPVLQFSGFVHAKNIKKGWA